MPIVTATPNVLTLNPGQSAPVTIAVDPLSDSGTINVPVTVTVPPQFDGTIEGNFMGTIPTGQHWQITGNVNLTGDMIVEGLLTGVDTFNLTGNGFQILVQNGGQLQFVGVPKTSWLEWGDTPVGWNVGDRIAVAPTAWQKTVMPAPIVWQGSWAGTTRPVDSPDVVIIDGSTQKPEVANLDRSIKFDNLKRIHFHNGAGVQLLRYLAVTNSGTTDVLTEYPIHFHLNGETSRGSLIESVVVENGKNHAFVPHGSHGITIRDCVAYQTISNAYWWDPPIEHDDPLDPNNSNDLMFDRCLAIGVSHPSNPPNITAFDIVGGSNNEWRNCVAVGVQGGSLAAGFRWLESSVAIFNLNNKAHNNRRSGIRVWTNSSNNHNIENFISYHNRKSAVNHGAYSNPFNYKNVVSHVGVPVPSGSDESSTVIESALGKGRGLLFENFICDDKLKVMDHSLASSQPVIHRNCTYTAVVYAEGTLFPSFLQFFDCGLVPADFNMAGARPTSVAEIYEGGILLYRWANGVWT